MAARRIIEAHAARAGGSGRLGGAGPLVCTPLVGRTGAAVLAELEVVLAKGPDLLEWRVDFLEDLARTAEVLEVGRAIRARAGELPLILTRRSTREGGQPVALDEPGVLALYQAACRAGLCDYLDQELSSGPAALARARAVSREEGVGLIVSFHDFQRTPPAAALFGTLAAAAQAGADVAKLAVMPAGPEDVLTLLGVTLRGHRELGLPLITMAMGAQGVVTRLVGAAFGSAVTFAIGAAASAPGQLHIEDLRCVEVILRRAGGATSP